MIHANDPTPQQAREIIARMGETGQPPERGALFVNVATNDILGILRGEYLSKMREYGRNSSFKLIQATFGGGKTQFLMSLREIAWEEGFATANVGLSAKECPFDRPEKIYREIAKKVELPPAALDEMQDPGVDVVLRTIAERRVEEYGVKQVKDWLRNQFERAPVESRSFRKAVSVYMNAVIDDDRDTEDLLADYLRGTDLPAAELTPHRIREQLAANNAFGFLRSLSQCLSHLSLPGMVLLFDEMDRNMSLPAKRRREIADNLRQMIDHCGQATLPGVLFCYAVPPEFMTSVVPEYPALQQRLKGMGMISGLSPLQPVIDLEALPIGPTTLMMTLGKKLLHIYEIGFEPGFDQKIQNQNIDALADEFGSQNIEAGARRTFVKTAIRMLEEQARGEEKRLGAKDLKALMTGRGEELKPKLDGEEEFF